MVASLFGGTPGARARAVAVLVVVVAALAGLLLAVTPAVAAPSSGIYAVVSKRDGFCGDNGRKFFKNYATNVTYENHTTSKKGGDSGDDVVWIPVRRGLRNTVSVAVQCRWSTPMSGLYEIRPTRNGQTFWFRSGGGFTTN